jgi:hypothetical protein
LSNEEWVRVGGADGFYAVPDPADPAIVYAEGQDGNVQRLHRGSGERRVIRPEPPEGQKYRFNWDSPLLVSPHDAKTVYYGGNRLFGSKDRGETWGLITPDLTSSDDAERDKRTIFGKAARDFLSRNDGVRHFGTITAIAESPLKAGVLWAGTDDGNLQVSKDGGQTWTNVAAKIPGVPKGTYVSRVEASRTGEGAAYVAFDGHRSNDFAVYVFFTADYGQTWKAVSGNISAGGTVHVVREHPKNPDVLFVGTEHALWMSWNRGGSWTRVRGKGLPTVPVDDLLIHPREGDLVLGTHGRGVYVLDDATPLVALPGALGEDLRLFPIRTATEWRLHDHKADTGHKVFLAPNPPEGALVTYWLKAKPGEKDEVKITVTDASGNVVRELKGSKEEGLNRTNWDLRHEAPVKPQGDAAESFMGPPRGPFVLPGAYSVKLTVGSLEATQTVTVEEDPRVTATDEDRRAWHDALMEAGKTWARADAADKAAKSLRKQLEELQESLKKRTGTPEALTKAVRALLDKVTAQAATLTLDQPTGFAGAPLAEEPDPLLPKARRLNFGLAGITAPPTPQQRALMERTARDVAEVALALNAIQQGDVPALNKLAFDDGVGRIDAGKPIP